MSHCSHLDLRFIYFLYYLFVLLMYHVLTASSYKKSLVVDNNKFVPSSILVAHVQGSRFLIVLVVPVKDLSIG